MSDAEYSALKKKLQRWSDQWRTCLGLRWWRITYVWDRDGTTTRRERPPQDRAAETAAFTEARWHYLDATIIYNMVAIAGMEDDERRERTVLHEHCHLLVNELRDEPHTVSIDYLHHEERVVSTLTHAFWWTRLHGLDEETTKKAANISLAQGVST